VVTQVQPITVIFTLPEEALPQINQSMAAGGVQVVAVSRDQKTELDHGTLQLVDNQIDQATGTIRLKAVFPNSNRALWPGQFVNVVVTLRTLRGATLIPSEAVQSGQKGQFVYVLKPDQTVESRIVQPGETVENQIVVESGIAPGETVITDGQMRLAPGAHVRVVNPVNTPPANAAKGGF